MRLTWVSSMDRLCRFLVRLDLNEEINTREKYGLNVYYSIGVVSC